MKHIIFLIALFFVSSVSLLAQPEDVPFRYDMFHVVDTVSPSYVFKGNPIEGNANQLWLHGYQGMYITSGNEPNLDIVAYYARTQNNFVFRSDVAAQNLYTFSDPTQKVNVKGIDNSLSRLRQINGVSYSLSYEPVKDMNRIKNKAAELNEDTVIATAEVQMEEKRKQECEQERVGFIAQDLQKIFPELVKADSSGFLYVDNMGLIPVIVEALKEQQSQIEQQQQQIDEQKELIENLMKLLGEARQVMLTKK